MQILGLCGSLRSDSYNHKLLLQAGSLLADEHQLVVYDWSGIPYYNQELENGNLPSSVASLKRTIRKSDALLFATPEYNYSIPGGLKNAIDWASRPAYQSVFSKKPCAIISASLAPTGGVRAQAHLKGVLLSMLSVVYPAPEFALSQAHQAFDDTGQLTDVRTTQRLKQLLDGFVSWSEQLIATR